MTDANTEIAEIEQLQQTDNTAYWKSDMPARYAQLLEAQDAGTSSPAGPSANQQRIAEIERMMAEPQNSGEYWHNEKLQQEYLALIDGKSPGSGTSPAGELAEALGVSEDVAADYTARVDGAFEGIDTADMEAAYEGLSDEAQSYGVALLLHPDKLQAYEASMPAHVLEELKVFESGMTPEEHGALKRALLL
jgi:hypothetical protein